MRENKVVVIALTEQEFEEMLDNRLELAFQRHAVKQPVKKDEPSGEGGAEYVSKKEAARLISVCTSTIDNAARAGKLRRHYVGKSVRFLRSEVLELAKSHTNHKQKNSSNE